MDVHTSSQENRLPCACTTVRKVSRVLGRTYDAALSPAGLTNTQFAVMRAVSSHTGEPLARIAHSLETDRTSLYRALNPMIRDGWIRIMDCEGSRYNSAKLTSKGARVLAAAERSWGRIQARLILEFGRTAYGSLVQELSRLAAIAGKYGA
jgi:DNA-binding MarR family transcriptional regulator